MTALGGSCCFLVSFPPPRGERELHHPLPAVKKDACNSCDTFSLRGEARILSWRWGSHQSHSSSEVGVVFCSPSQTSRLFLAVSFSLVTVRWKLSAYPTRSLLVYVFPTIFTCASFSGMRLVRTQLITSRASKWTLNDGNSQTRPEFKPALHSPLDQPVARCTDCMRESPFLVYFLILPLGG